MDYFNQESERLRFRKLTTDDIPRWLEFFKNNDNLKFLG
ncbi:MAG: ribosomal-protein-alanine N-acetyltransferase, partial [Cognaticolwellia sp.]